MASNYFVMEAANLFCGDHDPTASKHLTLSELQLPSLEEIYQDHHAGGSRVQVEINVGISKLTPTFKLSGTDPELLGQFGSPSGTVRVFTAYGAIRNKRTGEIVQSKAIMHGRLGKISPEAFKRGELQGHDYAINEVLHYELWFGGAEKIYWDFFTAEWRLDGQDGNAAERRALGLA